jgi:hypothetical protein
MPLLRDQADNANVEELLMVTMDDAKPQLQDMVLNIIILLRLLPVVLMGSVTVRHFVLLVIRRQVLMVAKNHKFSGFC